MFDQPVMVEICTRQQSLHDLLQKRNWGPLVSAQIFSHYLRLNMQRYWAWNVRVLKHVNSICLRLDMARQSEEIKLPWFNELLVIRPIIIIDHADDWSLLHLQNKTCLHKLLSGLKISLCQQMRYTSTANLQFLTMCVSNCCGWADNQLLVCLSWNIYPNIMGRCQSRA